ncbi:homocysteine S-methyltransferase family protein [candidate division KSB1 bacterium]|nr:homocysteine S-methyltransferase family protein [candidate division KSB1 bacterium]
MKKDLFSVLERGPMLFDGGIGTQLQALGLAVGEIPETWNMLYPEKVFSVHDRYCKAGAEILTTNTFGATPFKLKKGGVELTAYQVNKSAAVLAAKAAGDSVYVAGSIGPTGALLMMGEIDESELLSGFTEQARGLADGGAYVLIIETMSDIKEATIALQAVRQACALPAIVSMSFEPGRQGYRTMMGVDIPTAVKTLEAQGADIIGTNCGVGIDHAIEIVAEMRKHTSRPLLAEPNAGLPQLQQGRTVYLETAEAMAEKIPHLLNAGANLVGGCCGTTPEHITAFRMAMKKE